MDLSKTKISNPNLIREFDKRIESIRRTYNDKQLQALLKTLDQSFFLVQAKETPPPRPPRPTPPPAPSRDAYFYLYVQRDERLSRLNVTKLSEAPVFELVCNFGPSHRRNALSPVVCFNAESHILMMGDVFIHQDKRPKTYKPFFEVFSVNADKSPSFLPCPPTIAPALTAPKVDPIVFTLHGKIYVLGLHLYAGQPCFEVYDNGEWETLPPPPYFPCVETEEDGQWRFNTRFIFHALYAWDHKIVVCLEEGTFCFDTETVKWTYMQDIDTEFEGLPVLQCVAEYKNFLIAKPFFSEELLVYELDADGFPEFYQDLEGIEEIFADSRIESSSNSFIIPFPDDADRFCFICSGTAPWINRLDQYFLRVAVFRMTISNLDGKKKVTAELEARQTYLFKEIVGSSFDPHIYSAFLKRDNLDLDNLKADRSFGRPCLD